MTNTIFRFRKFPVYKDAREFRLDLKKLSKEKFPSEEDYILTRQLWRALDSVVLNIAEGADKHSDKDFSRYLNNSLASLNEVVGCLELALDDEYITIEEYNKYFEQAENILKQLKAFLSKVRKDDKRF